MQLVNNLFRFIEKYGTHAVVGVKIGGTDIIYAKQQYSSPLQPSDVQKKLKDLADEFFLRQAAQNNTTDGAFNKKEKVLKLIRFFSFFGSIYLWLRFAFL